MKKGFKSNFPSRDSSKPNKKMPWILARSVQHEEKILCICFVYNTKTKCARGFDISGDLRQWIKSQFGKWVKHLCNVAAGWMFYSYGSRIFYDCGRSFRTAGSVVKRLNGFSKDCQEFILLTSVTGAGFYHLFCSGPQQSRPVLMVKEPLSGISHVLSHYLEHYANYTTQFGFVCVLAHSRHPLVCIYSRGYVNNACGIILEEGNLDSWTAILHNWWLSRLWKLHFSLKWCSADCSYQSVV